MVGALGRALRSMMNRLDWFLLALGPAAILLLWAFLPAAVPEGSHLSGEAPSNVVAELVGYTFDAAPAAGRISVGRGPKADFRLHNAPIALVAAYFEPPRPERPDWIAVPAHSGLTLRLDTMDDATRVVETSVRPWRDGDLVEEAVTVGSCASPRATLTPVALRQIRLRPAGGDREAEILWLADGARAARAGLDVVSCAAGGVWSRPREGAVSDDPCGEKREGWKRARWCWLGRPQACIDPLNRAWGVRLDEASGSRLVTAWGDGVSEGSAAGLGAAGLGAAGPGFGLSMNGPELAKVRLGIEPGPTCESGCEAPDLEICPRNPNSQESGESESVQRIGALELRDGDLLALGRTRFLVRPEGGALELYHARNPRAPGYFRSSSGHDVYHPNRRVTWTLPECTDPSHLTLLIKPPARDAEIEPLAELPMTDRRRFDRIRAAAAHHGAPQELPAVVPNRVVDRELLTLCVEAREDGGTSLRMAVDSPRAVRLRTAERDEPVTAAAEAVLVSQAGDEEVLLTFGGHLLRVAPAAAQRVTRRARLGLALFLTFILGVSAVPLTAVRILDRRKGRRGGEPSGPGLATLHQLTGVGLAVLLFLGASFQLFLALHPELAGKPDYFQAFLQGVVVVAVVLAVAAGFTFPASGLPGRAAGASLGAALALIAAVAWWWWDAHGLPSGFWLTAMRDAASGSSGPGPAAAAGFFGKGGMVAFAAVVVFAGSDRLRWPRLAEWGTRRGLALPSGGFLVLAAAGLALGVLQRSALAFELAILAGLAWYAGVYWAFARRGLRPGEEGLRHRAALYSLGSGLVMLAFLIAFFAVGADLPDVLSFLFVLAGLGIIAAAVRIMVEERFSSILRVLTLWLVAILFGAVFAALVLTDMGSIAAWIPAVLTGLFLWLVRPEEQENRDEEPRKAWSQLLLAIGSGCILLGVLDVFKVLVQALEWSVLDRPRQRLDLADDVSYITAGEWITQVRWLASQHDGEFQWVPNVNSDVAVFGLAAGFGTAFAVVASLLVLWIAGCVGLAADRALREARVVTMATRSDRLPPVLFRSLGLFSGMVCVLLVAQWLVHLATGVVLHLPITGLVFPWLSHGNTTHVLYTAAVLLPMAAMTALIDR